MCKSLNYVEQLKSRTLPGIIWALFAIFVSACSGDIGISDVQFGSFVAGDSSIAFRAKNSFSREQEPIFGWVFSMKNPPQEFTIREIVEGPTGTIWEAPPSTPEVQVTDGGKTAQVAKVVLGPSSPFLFHHWSISNTDPIGKYKASLYVDGKLIRQVEFEVTN